MGELINQSQRSLVYKEWNSVTKSDVLWKVCSPAINSLAELINEYEVTASLSFDGIRTPLSRGVYQNKEAFSYRYFDGVPLKKLLKAKKLTLKEFLRIAISISQTLVRLHETGISHLRINSNNILYNLQSAKIELIDFSLANNHSFLKLVDFQSWGEELSYIAPEQTGRLNQLVDNRTDLYSLGVVMYEMLTGQLPFSSQGSAELVLSHLIQVPVPVAELDAEIPELISDIVDKLLEKKPDDRYQSAFGLLHDLELCQRHLTAKTPLTEIQIAQVDYSHQLRLTENIVGRASQLKILSDLADQTSLGGNHLLFLSGDTGMGKTSLIESFKKYVQDQGGIMLTEKYESLKQNIPHYGITTALKEVAAIILSESDTNLAEWKSVLHQAADENRYQLIDLVPEFEWIIGEVSGAHVNRDQSVRSLINLSAIYQRILEGITTLKKFVVLFIDDLQWADESSFSSIRSLISNQKIPRLFIICSYRSGSSFGSTHSMHEITELKNLRKDAATLHLGNLSMDDIVDFINDSFPTEDVRILGEITYEKTLGHPFFMHQFFRSLYSENILRFSPQKTKWVWDREKMGGVQITDNVVDYISGKVEELSAESRRVLMIAACLGTNFHYTFLQSLNTGSEHSLRNTLYELLNEKIIESRKTGEYRFTHERVREASYSIFSEEEKGKIHYEIARQLFYDQKPAVDESLIFEIANHFNSARSYILPEDRFEIIRLNFRAGFKAKKSAAFEVAYQYFTSGINLVEEADWDDHYEDVLNLYNQATEVAMIMGAHKEAEKWLEKSVRKSRSINDSIKAHEIKLNHLSENHKFPEAVAYLLDVLRQIGYPIPRNPGKITILKEYVKVKWLLKDKKIENIPNLPPIENEKAKAFIKLTVNSLASIFGNAPDILPIVIFTQVRLSLIYGNSVYSPIAYCSYGFALSVFTGELEKGYRFGKMALSLVDQLDAEIIKAKVLVQFYAFLSYWKDPIRESIAPLREAYFIGKNNGDFLYAAFGLSFHSAIRLHTGENLVELLSTMTADCNLIKAMNQDLVYIISESQRQLVINLTENVTQPWILKNEKFDETLMLKQLDELGDSASKFDIYYYKLLLACIFNEYSLGVEYSESAAIYEDETTARQITYPTFLMFSTMAILKDSGSSVSSVKKQRRSKKMASRLKLMQKIAKHAPQNFNNKCSFLNALFFEQKGDHSNTVLHYHASINEAQASNFIHEEAIAREQLAYYYMKKEEDEYAELMLQKAYDCYEKWGAITKCGQLRNKYPMIIGKAENRSKEGIAGFQNIYDLNMIINANQALSSENTLEGLLKRFMEIVIKNASASNATIVLQSARGISARAIASNEAITILNEAETAGASSFPATVINYVARTLTVYNSTNLSQEKFFAFDPYIQENKPVSACCIPIIAKDNFLGAIYLENNLAEAAFDSNRIGIFKTLAAQLAISLDNVFLYEQMEQKVNDRTIELVQKNTELSKEKKKSDDLLLNILPAETAEELKNNGKTTARFYKEVTVLFSDIREFSKYAEILTPEQLVFDIDLYFGSFDEICTKHGLEKIKTIGDAYMAVGGLPENNKATVKDVLEAAISMLQFTQELASKRKKANSHFFEIRVGIHTGPVIAGVVGLKKFQFDLWGDTVNIAARMEQNSQPGKINISQQTYELIKDHFNCTPRGKIKAKSLGEIDMYFVDWQPQNVTIDAESST